MSQKVENGYTKTKLMYPWCSLALAVIEWAKADLTMTTQDHPKYRKDAEWFLNSEWCENLSELGMLLDKPKMETVSFTKELV
jgi:hypothetical protein